MADRFPRHQELFEEMAAGTMASDSARAPVKRGAVTMADVAHLAARYEPANELSPAKVAAQSVKVWRWVCGIGPDHRYEAMPINVYKSARGAWLLCSGRRPSVTNRLNVLYPQVAVEWDLEGNDRSASAVVAAISDAVTGQPAP